MVRPLNLVHDLLLLLFLRNSTVSVAALLKLLETCRVCPGHPDEQYEDLAKGKKGRFLSPQGELVAYEDGGFTVDMNGKRYMRTIRTSHCDILIHGDKCESCSQFKPTLRAMHSCWLKKPQSPRTPNKFANNRYLNTPDKLKKLKLLQARAAFLQREVHLLAGKVSTSAVPVEAALNAHLLHKMEEGSESRVSHREASSGISSFKLLASLMHDK